MAYDIDKDSLRSLLFNFFDVTTRCGWGSNPKEAKEDLLFRIMSALFRKTVNEFPGLIYSSSKNSRNATILFHYDYREEEAWLELQGDIDTNLAKTLFQKAKSILINTTAECGLSVVDTAGLFSEATDLIYEVAWRLALNTDVFEIRLEPVCWTVGFVEEEQSHSTLVHKRLYEFFGSAIFSSGFFEETTDKDRAFLNITVQTKTGEVEICETNYSRIIKQILQMAAVRECAGNDTSLDNALEKFVAGLCKEVDLPMLSFQYGYKLKQRG